MRARRRADAGHRDGAGARGWASPWEWLFDPEAHLGLTHAPQRPTVAVQCCAGQFVCPWSTADPGSAPTKRLD
jgi:hypothetical protein